MPYITTVYCGMLTNTESCKVIKALTSINTERDEKPGIDSTELSHCAQCEQMRKNVEILAHENTNSQAAQAQGEKREEAHAVVCRGDRIPVRHYASEGVHHVVEDDGHAVVEQRLAKDDEIEVGVDADLLENGQHGHRVHGCAENSQSKELAVHIGARAQHVLNDMVWLHRSPIPVGRRGVISSFK